MDLQITPTNMQIAADVLSLLQVCLRTGLDGHQIYTRVTEALQQGMAGYMAHGTVELNIGGQISRLSPGGAAAAGRVGFLAGKMRQDSGTDFLTVMPDVLEQLLRSFRQRTPVTLTPIFTEQGAVALSSSGSPKRIVDVPVSILILRSLGLETDEVGRRLGQGEEIRLRPA